MDQGILDALVIRFEARGRHPLFSKMLNDYLDAMPIDKKGLVLDLGCGTGLAARVIAKRPGFSGRVIGVDLSPYLVAVAERLARDEGIIENTEFRTGDAHSLEFAECSFDAVVAHTLLNHVDNPLAVLRGAARILKVGGMVGINSSRLELQQS